MVLFRMLSMKLHQTHVNIIYWRPDKTSAIENDLYSFTLFYVLSINKLLSLVNPHVQLILYAGDMYVKIGIEGAYRLFPSGWPRCLQCAICRQSAHGMPHTCPTGQQPLSVICFS